MVLGLWESETWKSILSNELITIELPLFKIWKASSEHQGLILETSAFQIFQTGKSTFINLFDKTKF